MENVKESTVKKRNNAVIYQVERVSLSEFGYEKSGAVKGDPEIYQSYLNRILNGDLVEENYKGLPEDEKNEKRAEIGKLEKQEKKINAENSKLEKDILEKKGKIEEYRQKLLDLREKRGKDPGKAKKGTFNPFKFNINLFILLMLSAYLFFFYISATYRALYVDFEEIADHIAQGTGMGSIMPGPGELTEAISYNFLLFLVPFIFFAFGWAFHVILEMTHRAKFIFLGMLIAVTFTVDFLLAMIIHGNTELAKELMGLNSTHWYLNPTFYIILFLGFLVYIVWSILLDSLLREWDKGEIPRNINKIIKHLTRDIRELESKKTSNSVVSEKLKQLRDDVSTVMYGNLKRYIDQFSTGWLSYLSPESMRTTKEMCVEIKRDFEEKHAIKPGLVRVISRKG